MIKINKIQEIIIFLWFIVALNYSLNTKISLIITLTLWSTIILKKILVYKNFNMILNKNKVKYFLWVIVFVTLCGISSIWALDGIYSMQVTVMLIKLFFGSTALIICIDTKDKWIKYFNLFLIASVFMIIRIIIYMPKYSKSYLVILNATGLYFNTVSQILAFLIIGAYFLKKYTNKNIYYLYIFLAYFIIMYSGSRKALLIPIIGIVLMEIFQRKKGIQKYKSIIISVLIVIIAVYLISKNELLMERLNDLFISVFTDNVVDESTIERNYYRNLAINMFIQKPFLGYGIDNFQVMLKNIGYSHIAYSHNNYTEIASNLGIVGLISYYWYYFYIIVVNFKYLIKKNIGAIYVIVGIIVLMIFEYGIVSYGIQLYHILFVFYSTIYLLRRKENGK